MVEALEVLDEVELGAGGRGGLRHGIGRLPGGGDERVGGRQPRGLPRRDPADERAEAGNPVGPLAAGVPGPGEPRTLGWHEYRDVVTAPREPVRIGQDGAHATRDANVWREKGDLHLGPTGNDEGAAMTSTTR